MSSALWQPSEEEKFFRSFLPYVPPETLFYRIKVEENIEKFVAYYPKYYKGSKTTLQSRNAYIGAYTEKWFSKLIEPIAKKIGCFVETGVVCEELELTKNSPADVVICKEEGKLQKAENIVMIFEIKMSVVWNWELIGKDGDVILKRIGDFHTHTGNPSLLRSDTMLKAIGKSINIRVASLNASKIPIFVVGNTPITRNYYKKVDHLKQYGIIQGFISVNPKPSDDENDVLNIKSTPNGGFVRMDSYKELENIILEHLKEEKVFFSAMLDKITLGKIIEIANREKTYESKAIKFLKLLRGVENEN